MYLDIIGVSFLGHGWRRMTQFTVFFVIGIAVYHCFPFFPRLITATALSGFVVLLAGGQAQRKLAALRTLAVLSGCLTISLHPGGMQGLPLPPGEAHISGETADVPEIRDNTVRFTISHAVVNGREIRGNIRLYVNAGRFGGQPSGAGIMPGDLISARARISAPTALRNPGVYAPDMSSGISATGSVTQLRILAGRCRGLCLIQRYRQRLAEIVKRTLSAENAAFHLAIITGLKQGISDRTRDAFNATGLAHVLSISGTHFGLLAFLVFSCIKKSVKLLPYHILVRITLRISPDQAAVLFTLPALIVYALISGMSTPTIRSLIMISVYLTALFIGRNRQWDNALSLSALIILLWNPHALFEPSFQLSFLAIISIGSALDRIRVEAPPPASRSAGSVIHAAMEKTITVLMITAAATIGTAPLVILLFKQFSVISLLSNLVITPFICFIILPAGLITGFLALLCNLPALPLGGLIDAMTSCALSLVHTFSHIPFAGIRLHNPSPVLLILYYLSLWIIFRGRKRRHVLPFVVVLVLYICGPYYEGSRTLGVTILDVGQGDASVVKLPDGKAMLIDGGAENNSAGRRAVAPYLWAHGIKSIDFLVLSHYHPDHYGGLLYIMDNFPVGEAWAGRSQSKMAEEFRRKLNQQAIPFRTLQRGDYRDGTGYRIYILHPYDEFQAGSARGGFSNENSASLVLKIVTPEGAMLFPGDIEEEAEEDLLHLGGVLSSDVIKVPHHGGRTSSSPGFLDAVSPAIAVISAGLKNPFHHPHEQTLMRYQNSGVQTFRTDRDGAVTITFRKGSIDIETYREGRLKRAAGWRDEIRNIGLLFH